MHGCHDVQFENEKKNYLNMHVVFALLGLFYVIGVAVWGGEYYSSLNCVGATFDITAAFLAFVGACFLCVTALSSRNGKNSTSPSHA